jgi:hypothetical protein
MTQSELAVARGGARSHEALARLATFLLEAPRPQGYPASMPCPVTLDFTPLPQITAPASVREQLP